METLADPPPEDLTKARPLSVFQAASGQVCCTCSDGPSWRYAGRWNGAHESCEKPSMLVCVGCGGRTAKRCRTSRGSRCKPCARSYRVAVHHVARSGLMLGGRTYLVTFTAPGAELHSYRGWICPCTSESTRLDSTAALALWNASCVHRWNRLHQATERRVGGKLSCFKAVEVQRRGALHLHVLVRVDRSVRLPLSMLRSLAMRHGFGHAVDVQEVSSEHAAWYVAKYVSKSTDERDCAPFLDRATGEIGTGRWRAWSSTRGRRSWGATMASVRAAQSAWVLEQRMGSDATDDGAAGARCDGEAVALDPRSQRYANGDSVSDGSGEIGAM